MTPYPLPHQPLSIHVRPLAAYVCFECPFGYRGPVEITLVQHDSLYGGEWLVYGCAGSNGGSVSTQAMKAFALGKRLAEVGPVPDGIEWAPP